MRNPRGLQSERWVLRSVRYSRDCGACGCWRGRYAAGHGLQPGRDSCRSRKRCCPLIRWIMSPQVMRLPVAPLCQVAVVGVGAAVGPGPGHVRRCSDSLFVRSQRKNSSWKRRTCSRASTGRFCAASCARPGIRLCPGRVRSLGGSRSRHRATAVSGVLPGRARRRVVCGRTRSGYWSVS